jgi:hypothetical protein
MIASQVLVEAERIAAMSLSDVMTSWKRVATWHIRVYDIQYDI